MAIVAVQRSLEPPRPQDADEVDALHLSLQAKEEELGRAMKEHLKVASLLPQNFGKNGRSASCSSVANADANMIQYACVGHSGM